MPFDKAEYSRWVEQAEYTLRSAAQDKSNCYFSWSCLKVQQAAEYALKALLHGLGFLAVGHSVLRLLNQLESRGREVGEGLRNDAMTLDRYYIPTRYPNAHAERAPYEFYNERAAQEAVEMSERILCFVKEAAEGAR